MMKKWLLIAIMVCFTTMAVGVNAASATQNDSQRTYLLKILYPAVVPVGVGDPVIMVNVVKRDLNFASWHPLYLMVIGENHEKIQRIDTEEHGAASLKISALNKPGAYHFYVSPWPLNGNVKNDPSDSYAEFVIQAFTSPEGFNYKEYVKNTHYEALDKQVSWPAGMPIPSIGFSWVGPVTMVLTTMFMLVIYLLEKRKRLDTNGS